MMITMFIIWWGPKVVRACAPPFGRSRVRARCHFSKVWDRFPISELSPGWGCEVRLHWISLPPSSPAQIQRSLWGFSLGRPGFTSSTLHGRRGFDFSEREQPVEVWKFNTPPGTHVSLGALKKGVGVTIIFPYLGSISHLSPVEGRRSIW